MATSLGKSSLRVRMLPTSESRKAPHNSFTEGEAKSRIEKMGFSSVTNLKKDDNGVWRGRAMKDGKAADVSVDYQGNVIQAGAQGTTAPSNAAQGGTRR